MFAWTYLDRAGDEIGRSQGFDQAAEAEDWIGSSWPELLERGIESVELRDQDRGTTLYRMGLGGG